MKGSKTVYGRLCVYCDKNKYNFTIKLNVRQLIQSMI